MSDKKAKTVIALGYFDSVHNGHRKVILTAKKQAEKLNATLTVFTFGGNLKAKLLGVNEKVVYTPTEREKLLKGVGADTVFFAPVTDKFLSLGKLAFLNELNRKYDICCYVSGKDYKFGKLGKGDVEYLKKYAILHGQTCVTVGDKNFEEQKISTTRIKKLLTNGDVEKANVLLGKPYFLTGTVISDRKVGRTLGFPTANLMVSPEKHPLKDGVYAGKIKVGGKNYRAVINYGARPTFEVDERKVEAHLLDFNGQLYGEQITVIFDKYLREIIKFSDTEKLKEQITKDVMAVRMGKYD